MQFVAPAQIVLVLWLLAATAPAATALMNGSLAVLIDARSRDLQLLPVADDDRDESADDDAIAIVDPTGAADFATLIFLALADGGLAHPLATDQGAVVNDLGKLPVALSSSVLHTAVQRHRPKLA